MKKAFTLFAALFLALSWASAQDVYFAGNDDGTGKIWKNNTLVYSVSDTASVIFNDMKVANDSTIFSAGYNYSDLRGHVWLNDTVLFTSSNASSIKRIDINANGWTAAGSNKVWQNGNLLYEYPLDTLIVSNIYALSVDPTTNDIYAGGTTVTPGVYACVWKNDTLLWMEDTWSSIKDLYFDGENLYAAGFIYGAESIDGAVWQNDSIIFQIPNGEITTIVASNGSLYWAGVSDNTAYIWQDSEVLYDHAFTDDSFIHTLVVNEFGVYYAGKINDVATVWQDGEILYQPEGCDDVVAMAVLANETPQPAFTLTVEVDSIGGGTVVGGGTFYYGDTATIEAIPDIGCEFLFWNDGIVTNPRDIIITQDTSFIAHFNRFEYTIQTAVTPEDAGSVIGGGAYHYGDTITLEAVANDGYEFLRWTDSITDNPRSVVVTQDSTFTAQFGIRHYTITVESDHPSWGSVTGGGSYAYGTIIQISATANLGFAFAGWTDGVMDNPRIVTVTQDETFTAHFEIKQCTITTLVSPENAGTVNGGGTYSYGETARLTAHSNTGYVYKMWDDGVMDNPRNVFVEDDATYTAIFTPLLYEITVESDPEEGGSISGAGIYEYGSTAVLTATANENYLFICWSDGIITNPRNVTVTGNAHFKALFHLNGTPQHTVTVLANDPSLGTVSGSGSYPEGATIEISATPNTGAYFMGWDDGNTDNPRSVTVTQNMTFTAIFTEVETFTITVRPEYLLQGTTYGDGTYPAGTVISIGAIPNPGYYFSGWQDGNMDNPRSITVTEDAEYIASFSESPTQTYTITVYYDDSQGFILGAGTYVAGATASVAAIPADGFVFKKWNDDTTDNPKVVVVDHDIFLAAFFESTGIDEIEGANLLLYPNPANSIIHIDGLEGEHEITIYNTAGSLVKTVIISDDNEIGINELPEGLYLIRIDGKGFIKFVKRQ